MSDSPDAIAKLSLSDLKRLVLQLVEENAAQRSEIAALREEIARLKGLKGRPQLKPSGMDKQTKAREKAKQGRKQAKRRRGAKRLAVDEDRVIAAAHPEGSRFKGYEDYVAQELEIKRRVVRYRRERWLTPEGRTLVAPLPAGLRGHFGPELRRFVLAAYHQGQATVERLLALLCDLGIAISKRQLLRLLSDGQEAFTEEAGEVLRAGLASAAWISADDTGARHRARNGVSTQIGNQHFSYFATSFSKSRLNFLELLCAGRPGYVINEQALCYMRRHRFPKSALARLEAAQTCRIDDQDAWLRHLKAMGIKARKDKLDPIRIATEGALWGNIAAQGLLLNAVILSDDAGQFNVGHHALCWVHAERLIHKLDTFNERQRSAVAHIRTRIWQLYADLKAYRRDPTRRRKRQLERRFDDIFTSRTGFSTLDRLLARLHANKLELLVVLDRPEVPLNTNGSENDIRCQVTRRKISGSTRSDQGRQCLDAFLSLIKTCKKLGISFRDYLADRLKLPNAQPIQRLAEIIAQRQTASA